MKNIFLFILACMLVFLFSCEEERYPIPDGPLTGVSHATTPGITNLDGTFTVTANFAVAEPGESMIVTVLDNEQSPVAGSEQTATVEAGGTISLDFNRNDLPLLKSGDRVTVIFSGKTDYAAVVVKMENATTIIGPAVYDGEKPAELVRSDEVAYLFVDVDPVSGPIDGTVEVSAKNSQSEPYSIIGQFASKDMVPISGSDFAQGQDTMWVQFKSVKGSYTDIVEKQYIVREPYFFYKRAGELSITDATKTGYNLLTNSHVADSEEGIITLTVVSDELRIRGGADYVAAGKSIEFVKSTFELYDFNNSNDAKDAYNSGTPVALINPLEGEGVFVFKITDGPQESDVYYGMIDISLVKPGDSVEFEYRIGDSYYHDL